MPSGDERVQQVEFHLFHLPATVIIPLVAPEEEIRRQLERKKTEGREDKDRKHRWTVAIYISFKTEVYSVFCITDLQKTSKNVSLSGCLSAFWKPEMSLFCDK